MKPATMMMAVLFIGMLSCAMAEEHRKLLQLQQPWLRLPAYEQINPFQVLAAVSTTVTDSFSYGILGDYLGDFFQDSFTLLQSGLTDFGCATGFC